MLSSFFRSSLRNAIGYWCLRSIVAAGELFSSYSARGVVGGAPRFTLELSAGIFLAVPGAIRFLVLIGISFLLVFPFDVFVFYELRGLTIEE